MTPKFFMIDPPWPQKKVLRRCRPNQTKELDYKTLPIEEIFTLLDEQIFPPKEEQHTVWLWSIDKFLRVVEQEMIQERGYRLHTRLIWDKLNGIAPCFSLRFSHEYLLWFWKPKFTPVAQNQRGRFTTVIREASREHSRKPDAAYDLAEKLWPLSPRFDIFSREARPGWIQWGDECNKFERITSG